MEKKFAMRSKGPDKDPDSPIIEIELEGLDEIFSAAMNMENLLCKYERFAEHVVLSCAMPEIPRYTVHDEAIDDTPIPQAFEMLDRILVRYRRMTKWMRQNGIDPESVAGDDKKTAN